MKLSSEQVEQVLENNSEKIEKIAKKLYLSGGNSDDLVQEGLIGFVDGIAKFDEAKGNEKSEAFVAFCLMCAKRQMLDAIRHAGRKKYNALNNSVPLDDSLAKSDLEEHNPERKIISQEEQKERLDAVVLSKSEKQVVEMLLLGLSTTEIAAEFGKSKKAIDDMCYRIRKKLKGE